MRASVKSLLPDVGLLKTLLKKKFDESKSVFKDKNFDKTGLVLKVLICLGFIVSFVFLFLRFSGTYLNVTIYGKTDMQRRAYEMLSIAYACVVAILTVTSVGHLNYAMFKRQENALYSAMPIDATTLFLAKITEVYFKQFALSAVFILVVNVTLITQIGVTFWNVFATLYMIIFLPSIAIFIASVLILPLKKLARIFKGRFVLTFIAVTVLLALCFVAYYYVLQLVKQVLLGEEIKYFFDEKKMNAISQTVKWLFPGNIFAGMAVGISPVKNLFLSLLTATLCWLVSMVIGTLLFSKAMKDKTNGDRDFCRKAVPIGKSSSVVAALMKKEFLTIFRTSSYMFSYFSVAVIMPLMVYFCISLGSSMAYSLTGVDTAFELAVFLTVLFGAMTNTFCATNISREGSMFYSIKAMPVSAKQYVMSKVLLCLIVSGASNILNAVILMSTRYVSVGEGLVVAVAGIALAFAQICFATRLNLAHARFSEDEDGETDRSDELVSKIIIIGLVSAAVLGGVLLFIKVFTGVRGYDIEVAEYICAVVISVASAGLFYYYLVRKLSKKYYDFSEGM